MKHTVTPNQVRHTAALAKLRLSGKEEQRMTQDLAALLELADSLELVSCEAETVEEHSAAPMRADEIGSCLDRAALLANAPEHADGMLRVPGAIRGDASWNS